MWAEYDEYWLGKHLTVKLYRFLILSTPFLLLSSLSTVAHYMLGQCFGHSMSVWTCCPDSPFGSWWSWFLSTDSSLKAGAQDTHPRLFQALKRSRCRAPASSPPLISMHRDKRWMLLLPSRTSRRLRCGRWSATEPRRLWDRSSSPMESWMGRGTDERPEEEQLSRGALWQSQRSGQAGWGEERWSPEEMRSSTAARRDPGAAAITICPEGTEHGGRVRFSPRETQARVI